MNMVEKLREIVTSLQGSASPATEKSSWELALRLLSRTPADLAEAEKSCNARDLEALDAIISSLENPGGAKVAAAADVSEDQMKSAMRAFRKRLKLMRLADESKLGGRQLTGGQQSEIDAIMPPTDFPQEVWQALARAEQLIHTGQGFYSLA